jgi:hypothetical protein
MADVDLMFVTRLRAAQHQLWHEGATKRAGRAEAARRIALYLGARDSAFILTLARMTAWAFTVRDWGPVLCDPGCPLREEDHAS